MRYIPEIAQRIKDLLPRPIKLMEVCGTHTINIFRYDLKSLLPSDLKLVSGLGCPVCVTPPGEIDFFLECARRTDVILATFGDMLKVPGSRYSLEDLRTQGVQIKAVYSPLDTLSLAKKHKDKKVVFAAVGFETTAPAVAVTIIEAQKQGLRNLLFAINHRTMPQALRTLVQRGIDIDGFILPAHVSTIIGARSFSFLAQEFGISAVITGFEAHDIMQGIFMLVKQIAEGRKEIEIQYRRAVSWEGNVMGKQLMAKVFEPCDAYWRGLGLIPHSGLKLRPEFYPFEAQKVLGIKSSKGLETPGCLCGDILAAKAQPIDCKFFAKKCTPEHPLGPCMVSTEGICAAWYAFSEK